jgi:hypothetical protein
MCTPIDIKIKDLAKITGKSYGRAYILMQRIRVLLQPPLKPSQVPKHSVMV